jgi:prophage antirepressor-like protein
VSQNTTEGNSYSKNFINEGNLYRLIVKSKLSAAEKFESWIFDEVLPSTNPTESDIMYFRLLKIWAEAEGSDFQYIDNHEKTHTPIITKVIASPI